MAEVLNSNNFDEVITGSDKPVVVDFYADWCGPCRMLAPVIEELHNESTDVNVYKVDVDASPDLAAKFGVNTIPTLIIFKEGKEFNKHVGALPKQGILDLLK